MSDAPVSGDPVSGDPVSGDPVSGDPVSGDPASGGDWVETICYRRGDHVLPRAVDLLDQTKLPTQTQRFVCRDVATLHDAIRRLVVRGAPAIGVAAAYGVTLADVPAGSTVRQAQTVYRDAIDHLATSRPTAVNLFWALKQMRRVVDDHTAGTAGELAEALVVQAARIDMEERERCRAIGVAGADFLRGRPNILTHCNAGALATSGFGTALAPIYHLHAQGERLHVYADETRPLLQGARLTAWELHRAGVPVTVCADSMAGGLMRRGTIDAVIVGADRIAANGDVANKVGTFPLAVLARYHDIPFFVAAPTSTIDASLPSGKEIVIEQRDREEIARPHGVAHAWVPDGVDVLNPAFDITPGELVTAVITEAGRANLGHIRKP